MAILSNDAVSFMSSTPQQTERLGIRLGELIEPRDIICLDGDLGAGKTALARGIGRGWGTTYRITSPTFTLINEYPRASDGIILYHCDFYRLQGATEIITTGIEDILDTNGAIMIEWPDLVMPFLPEDRLIIALSHVSEYKRGMRFRATGKRSRALLTEFRVSAFGR